ncbi:MAG: MarR family transcriptional regulator [Hellea sp.]|nr:MarR family transcriptional regulator [Hellea sp.]
MVEVLKNNELSSFLPPRLTRSPVDFADTTFHSLARNIENDYIYVLKTMVLPLLDNEHGLNLQELKILSTLDFYDSPLTPHYMAQVLRFDPATVTRATKKLTGAGMVVRSKNHLDSRSVNFSLSSEGKDMAEQYANGVKTVFDDLHSRLEIQASEERRLEYLNALYAIRKRSQAMREISEQKGKLRKRACE